MDLQTIKQQLTSSYHWLAGASNKLGHAIQVMLIPVFSGFGAYFLYVTYYNEMLAVMVTCIIAAATAIKVHKSSPSNLKEDKLTANLE